MSLLEGVHLQAPSFQSKMLSPHSHSKRKFFRRMIIARNNNSMNKKVNRSKKLGFLKKRRNSALTR